MKPIRFLKTLCWALLLSCSLGAYVFLANDAAPQETAEAITTERAEGSAHVLGDVLFLKKVVEHTLRVVPQ